MANILIVEDHSITQRVLSKRLRDAGYEVVTANDGLEALAVLADFVPDLIISDIAMPGMDGLTLLKRVREDERFISTPFLMLTTSVLDQHRQDAIDSGASGFLEKPVSSWELDATVRKLLTRQG